MTAFPGRPAACERGRRKAPADVRSDCRAADRGRNPRSLDRLSSGDASRCCFRASAEKSSAPVSLAQLTPRFSGFRCNSLMEPAVLHAWGGGYPLEPLSNLSDINRDCRPIKCALLQRSGFAGVTHLLRLQHDRASCVRCQI
jgi:hypothetical protein